MLVEIHLGENQASSRRAEGASQAFQRPNGVAPDSERRLHGLEGCTKPVPFVAVCAPQVGDDADHRLGETSCRLFNRIVGPKKSLELGIWLARGRSRGEDQSNGDTGERRGQCAKWTRHDRANRHERVTRRGASRPNMSQAPRLTTTPFWAKYSPLEQKRYNRTARAKTSRLSCRPPSPGRLTSPGDRLL